MNEVTILGKQFQLLISSKQIQTRISELAEQINKDNLHAAPVLIAVLNGAFMFAADLVRQLTVNPEIHFYKVSSYGDQMSGKPITEFEYNPDLDLEDRAVLIVEDIVDTGYTCQFLRKYILESKAATVKVVSLLFKPESFLVGPRPDYVGFEISPTFVVGYGLDFAHKGRELSGIYQLKS